MKIQWEAYLTTQRTILVMEDAEARDELVREFEALEVGKVYIEGFRGVRTPMQTLERADEFFRGRGFATATGFMMVGDDDGFGRLGAGIDSRCGFFCYTDPRLRENLTIMCSELAGVFHEMLIDDAFETACTCDDCEAARDGRDWGRFRRDLMLEISRDCVLTPARNRNPGITVNIKFPQYYDRLHRFGYDVERQTELFDGVFVGVEVRDPEISDYGWVRPYQGTFNILRARSFAGDKFRGGWFDDITCGPEHYAAQAEAAARGGAPRLVLFNWRPGIFRKGSRFRKLMDEGRPRWNRLAAQAGAGSRPAAAVFSPPNAEAGDELFIFDYLGQWRLPLQVHTRTLPERGPVIATTHALAMPGAVERIKRIVARGGTAALTLGCLWLLRDDPELMALAGIKPRGVKPMRVESRALFMDGRRIRPRQQLGFAGDLDPDTAEVVVAALQDGCEGQSVEVPVVTVNRAGPAGGRVVVLNIETFSHHDFMPRESLNVPIPVDLVHWPAAVVTRIRDLIMG